MKLWKALVRTGLVGLLLVVAAPAPRAHATVLFTLDPVTMGSGGTFSIDFLVTPFTFGVPSSTSNPADIQITGGQYKDSSSAVVNDFSTDLPSVSLVSIPLSWDGSVLAAPFDFSFIDGLKTFEVAADEIICNGSGTSCAGSNSDDGLLSSTDHFVPSRPSAAGAPEPPGWVLLAAGASLVGWICQSRARRKMTPPVPAIAERTC